MDRFEYIRGRVWSYDAQGAWHQMSMDEQVYLVAEVERLRAHRARLVAWADGDRDAATLRALLDDARTVVEGQ